MVPASKQLQIRGLRQKRGLTQEQLGELVGVDKAQVSNWETGKRFPSAGNLAALATAFNVDIADLFRDPSIPTAHELLEKLRAITDHHI
jgi:putative transcriptional regulator